MGLGGKCLLCNTQLSLPPDTELWALLVNTLMIMALTIYSVRHHYFRNHQAPRPHLSHGG